MGEHVVIEGMRIEPGDKILIALRGDPDKNRVQELANQLKERFPEAEFTLVAGTTGLAVRKTDEP